MPHDHNYYKSLVWARLPVDLHPHFDLIECILDLMSRRQLKRLADSLGGKWRRFKANGGEP